MLDYLLFPYVAITLSLLLLAGLVYTARNRRHPSALRLMLMFVSILGWILFNTLELIADTETWTLFWAKICYLFIFSTPVLWIQFLLDYYGFHRLLRFPASLLFWIIPIFGMVMEVTNHMHYLFWQAESFVLEGPYLALQVVHGPVFYIFWGYANLLILIGLGLIARENFRSVRIYRAQTQWVTIGGIIVLLFNAVYVSRIFPHWQKDYTPIGLAMGGLCFMVALFRFQFLKVAPLRTQVLFEAFDEGVIVLDADRNLVSSNPAAQAMFQFRDDAVAGRPVAEVLPQFPLLAELADAPQPEWRDFEMEHAQETLYLQVKSRRIEDVLHHFWGIMLMIRDVTREKQVEQAQQEERQFALTLSEIAAALNNTRELNPLLDVILSLLPRITGCDSANIMLIENGYGVVKRSLDPAQSGLNLPVATTENLRWMVENRKPMVMSNTGDFPSWVSFPQTTWVRSYVGAPIIREDEVIGFINLDSPQPYAYNERTAERLTAVAYHIAIAIHNAQIFEMLEELATTDDLTGIDNRRNFFALAAREYDRAKRYQRPLTALMMDLDLFKRVNDSYGHHVGDVVLRETAQICLNEVRKIDIIGRYGGEEFALVLAETTLERGLLMAERLRAKVEAHHVSVGGFNYHVTISIGVAELSDSCQSLEELIDCADQALYLAKQAGRNQVMPYLGG